MLVPPSINSAKKPDEKEVGGLRKSDGENFLSNTWL